MIYFKCLKFLIFVGPDSVAFSGPKIEKNMNDLMNCYGNWAMVAGAAEGVGEAFSLELASRGFNLILIDRNLEKLEALATSLRNRHNGSPDVPDPNPGLIRVIDIHLDLSSPEAAEVMMKQVQATGCRLMIYVAAFSKIINFTSLTPEDIDRFIDTNTRTLMQMVHRFSVRVSGQGQAGILLISSLAGIIGTPLVSSYAATKGFINLLGESLYHELKSVGIDITVCCAGITETPMFLSTKPKYGVFKPQTQTPGQVAAYALKMLGRRALCISGSGNRLAMFLLTRLLPRKMAAAIVARNMFTMYRN